MNFERGDEELREKERERELRHKERMDEKLRQM